MTGFDDMVGRWSGRYELWFEPGEPVARSATCLVVEVESAGTRFRYDWEFGDQQHKGHYLARPNGSMDFVDSFHTCEAIMPCSSVNELECMGTFEAGGETWKWRTAFSMPSPHELIVTAWNITPRGDETLATQARYERD